MRGFVIVIVAATWMAFAASASAQSAGSPDPARERHLALAGEYLELTQGGELFKQVRGQLEEEFGGSEMPEEQRAWMTDQLTDMFEEVMTATIQELRDDVADSFTVTELEGAIAFYASPLGRSVVSKQLDLNFEMQRVMAPMMITRITSLSEKFCQRFDCDALAESAIKNQR
jgi:hypothetical protein